jgi:hypothetical protein
MEQTTLDEHGWPSESVVEDLTLSKAMASFDRFLGEDPHIGSIRNFMVSTTGIFHSDDNLSVYNDEFTPEIDEPEGKKMSLMHHSGDLEKMFRIDENESSSKFSQELNKKVLSPPSPPTTRKASCSPNRPSNKKQQSNSPANLRLPMSGEKQQFEQ